MASGIIYGTTSNQYIECKIEWSSSFDIEKNRSQVSAVLYYRRTNTGFTTYGTPDFHLYIGDNHYTKTSGTVTIGTSWTKVLENQTVAYVNHNDDGTKSITIRATGSIPGTTLTSTNCSQTVALDNIPRVSEIDSIEGGALGSLTFIKWKPKSSSFKYAVKLSLGSWSYTSGYITPNTTGTYPWFYQIPYEVGNYMGASDKTGTMTATLYSYTNGGTAIGTTSKTFTVTMPDNSATQPTVVTMNLFPVSTLKSPYDKLYIQGHSKVQAILGFGTKYGATVEASNITVNGINYPSPYESDILSQVGTISVKATVKDSRGFYGTNYKDIEVIPYSKPYVRAKSGETSIIAARCDSSANFTDSGTYLKIKAKAVFSKVISNGTQLNYGVIKYRYRKEGGSYSAWQTILDCKANNSDEVITAPLLNGALDIKTNYQVQIMVTDDFYDSEPITIAVPSDEVYMHRPAGGKSMGLGGYSSGDGNLDVYWDIKARDGLSLFDSKGTELPLGSTMPLPRDQVSEGWNPDNLECGIYAVTSSRPLKQGDTVIMYNGVLIQMTAYVGGNVKIQLALTSDETRNPYYRVCWYGNWGNWRSFKL